MKKKERKTGRDISQGSNETNGSCVQFILYSLALCRPSTRYHFLLILSLQEYENIAEVVARVESKPSLNVSRNLIAAEIPAELSVSSTLPSAKDVLLIHEHLYLPKNGIKICDY